MIFGKEKNKGIILKGLQLEVVTIGEHGITEEDILIHDETVQDPTLHQMLVRLSYPTVTGIIRAVKDVTFEERIEEVNKQVKAHSKFKTADDLFFSGDTYEVS